jgi:hypothetical protein
LDVNSGLFTDEPIIIKGKDYFIDIDNGLQKEYLIGQPIAAHQTLKISVFRYGHFFFTKDQCIQKSARWSRAVSRFTGKPLKTKLELLDNDIIGVKSFLSKDAILNLEFPHEVRRVVEQYYCPGMIGGAQYAWYAPVLRHLISFLVKIYKLVISYKK